MNRRGKGGRDSIEGVADKALKGLFMAQYVVFLFPCFLNLASDEMFTGRGLIIQLPNE